jgi:hypothetical protein
MGGITAGAARDHRSLADPFSWGGLSVGSDEHPTRPVVTRFSDLRRSYLAPYWRALREIATPEVVDTFTPSHVAALLDWDTQDAVRAVPMTDEQAAGPAPVSRVGTGERRLRRVE